MSIHFKVLSVKLLLIVTTTTIISQICRANLKKRGDNSQPRDLIEAVARRVGQEKSGAMQKKKKERNVVTY